MQQGEEESVGVRKGVPGSQYLIGLARIPRMLLPLRPDVL